MSTSRELDRQQWQSYFDTFTKKHLRDQLPEDATIQVISPEIGDQEQAEHARLEGVTYDPKSNALQILLKNYDHLIYNPEEIRVEEDDHGFLRQMEVRRSDGTLEVLKFEPVGIQQFEG